MARRTEDRHEFAKRLVSVWRDGNAWRAGQTATSLRMQNHVRSLLSEEQDGLTGARIALQMYLLMTESEREQFIEDL